MKRFVQLSIFIMMICKLSFSTPQVRDILYWNGMTYHVYPFINVENRFDDAQLERLDANAEFVSTCNWRGYFYEFEIQHDSLFLVSIKNDLQEDLMAYVLGFDDRIMMDDYSDTLYLGYGKTFFDEDFPTMIYESEMTVVFKNGVVIYTRDNKNKSQHTELPHNIMKLHECIYSSIQWNALNKDILAKKPQVYVNYSIDSLGRVSDVELRRSSGYPDIDKEAMRVIASLPRFSSYFVCGKYLEKKYWQRIVFDTSKRPNINNINGFSKKVISPVLTKMIMKYYFVWYEYPSSTNEMISFIKDTESNWSVMACRDSVESTLNYLEKEKDKVLWNYETPEIDSMRLLVLNEKDTLFYDTRIRNATDVCWHGLISGFTFSYFSYPSTLQELIEYSGIEKLLDSATKYTYDNQFDDWDFLTAWILRKLRDLAKESNWVGNDTILLVTKDNDTIIHSAGNTPLCWREDFNHDIVMFGARFYDSEGKVVWGGEDLDLEWKRRTVWGIAPIYPVLLDDDYYANWHYFEYTKEKGLTTYCENDIVDMNTSYFKDLEDRIKRFAEEKKFGKIIFAAPTRI